MELGQVLTLQRGFDLPERARRSGPFPVVSSSGVTGSHDEFKVDPPGVVIGRYGSLGQVHWVTEPFWPLNTSLWVRDFKGNDPRFVSFLLETVSMDGSAAAAVPGVNRNHLHKLMVKRPASAIQHRVVAVLSTIDDWIGINERRIEILEHVVRSYFRYKAMTPPHVTSRSAAARSGAPDSLPNDWTSCRLGEIATLNYGKALPKARRRPASVPVVSSAGVIDMHDTAIVSGPGLVVGRKGNVGSVWWIEDAFYPIDTTYYVESDLPLEFLYWALQEAQFVDSHAAVPGLSRDQALAVEISLPPVGIVESIASLHREAFQAIAAYRKAGAAVAKLRSRLLPRLVTGRIDISDVDLEMLTPAEPD